mgnify:FL=1
MIYTENIDPKILRVGDVILTEEKFMIITKIDENGIEVLESISPKSK